MFSFVQKINGLILFSLLGGLSVIPSSSAPETIMTAGLYQPIASAKATQPFRYLESFTHLETMQKGGDALFTHRILTRLPQYKGLLQSAAQEQSLDWHLLAAMSYQESFWNPTATSPTGVRGLMMLTLKTAGDLGITDRLNPKNSIYGGARYFAQLHKRLPESIQEPDRTWMALAAYNIGINHLRDGRALTRHLGKNADSWENVKEYLPLLEKKDYYAYLRHGHARGNEAVTYVERIRQYRTILTWQSRIKNNDLALVRNHERLSGVLALVPQSAILPSITSL